MAIVRWEPFDSLFAPSDINQMFRGWMRGAGDEQQAKGGIWAPAVDVYETEAGVVVEAELPGVEAKDIEVAIEDGVLTIKGERRLSKEVREENYYRVERASGMFQRSMRLSADVDADKVSASYDNGVLKVTVPKLEVKNPKSIQVEVETKKEKGK